MGFGADVRDRDSRGVGEIFKDLEPEDLLKFGLIPEFVGRLPVIATLEDLDEEALVTILTEPKNALVKQYQRLFELEDAKLTFTDDALTAIAKRRDRAQDRRARPAVDHGGHPARHDVRPAVPANVERGRGQRGGGEPDAKPLMIYAEAAARRARKPPQADLPIHRPAACRQGGGVDRRPL